MILCNYVTENKEAFCNKVKSITAGLGIEADWLMAVMYVESLISANAVNPYSGAVGLIQFMPATAAEFGTSVDDLLQMSNVEQLDYVEKYFNRYAIKIHSFIDAYLAVFFPAAIGKPADWILQAPGLSAALIARQNKGMDFNNDKKITVAEVERFALSQFPADIQELLKKKR